MVFEELVLSALCSYCSSGLVAQQVQTPGYLHMCNMHNGRCPCPQEGPGWESSVGSRWSGTHECKCSLALQEGVCYSESTAIDNHHVTLKSPVGGSMVLWKKVLIRTMSSWVLMVLAPPDQNIEQVLPAFFCPSLSFFCLDSEI